MVSGIESNSDLSSAVALILKMRWIGKTVRIGQMARQRALSSLAWSRSVVASSESSSSRFNR